MGEITSGQSRGEGITLPAQRWHPQTPLSYTRHSQLCTGLKLLKSTGIFPLSTM